MFDLKNCGLQIITIKSIGVINLKNFFEHETNSDIDGQYLFLELQIMKICLLEETKIFFLSVRLYKNNGILFFKCADCL